MEILIYNLIRHMDKVDRYSFREFLVPAQPIPFNPSRLRTLNAAVVQALGDRSQPQRKRSLLEIVVDAYRKAGIKLRPGSRWLLLWQFIVVCIIIFYVLELGLLLAFRDAFWQDDLNNFTAGHIIFILVMVADILISPLKCYYEEGLLIKDISLILRKYLRGQFWIDFLGLLAVVIPLATGLLWLNLMKLVWLAKILVASRINIQFQRVTQLYIGLNTGYLVVKLIAFGFIYAHYMGLFFYMVSLWVYENNYYGPNTPNLCWVYNSWALYQMALILNWQQMYAYIIYYSVAVVTTIAYGDITPKNPIECIYTIVALIAVTILWGYIMTEILRVMIGVFTYQFDRRFTHFELVSKLRTENIQQEIQAQVRAHTNEIDREEQYRNRQVEEQIIHFLPSEPLYGLLLLIYHAFLEEMGFRFFSLTHLSMHSINCRSPFLEAFMKDVKEERHYTGDLLYCEGQSHSQTEEGHAAYYFTKSPYANTVMLGVGVQPVVKEGRVEKRGRSFELSKATTIFGQEEFLNGQERSHWAFCLSNCVLLVASRNSLLHHYHLLSLEEKEKVLMQMEIAAESSCLICHQEHSFLRCPYSFLNAKDILHSHSQVSRKSKIFKSSRTRLKTESSWTIFKGIRSIRMHVTREYRERLLEDRSNHSLYIQYELEEDNHDHDDEDFESKLHEAEVMVERLEMELMREMGRSPESLQYDCVHDYEHYKPHNNIRAIIWETTQKIRSHRQCKSDTFHDR